MTDRLRARRSLTVLFLLLAALAPAGVVEIQILQTTDVHGHVLDGGERGSGGWLRLATLIEKHRTEHGPARTVLVDCGDTIQGSQLACVSRGQVCVELMKALRYDVWVPGNHELDFGVRRCSELIRQMSGRTLCGNLTLTVGDSTQRPPAWQLFERDGARVAVVGASARYLQQWLWGEAMQDFRIETALSLLQRVLPEVLQARPDMVILALHQGWLEQDERGVNEVRDIARRFPEIDLILGGHTHRLHPGMRIGARTWYVQAGRRGEHLAVVRARVDTRRHRVLQIASELVPADGDVPPHAATSERIQPWLDEAAAFAERQVGRVSDAISAGGRPGESCATSELLCRALAQAAGTAVVLHGRLSRFGLTPGVVRERDLFALVPYENSIGVAALTRRELTEIIEEQLAHQNSYTYCGIWGISVDLNAAGRVIQLRQDGAAIADTARIPVAFSSYVLAGAGGRFPRLRALVRLPAAGLRDTGIQTRDAVRTFMRSHSPLAVEAKSWLRRDRP